MADRTLDIRGLLCPLTWARVRRELSVMGTGERLQVHLDHRPAVSDIRRNASQLGHEVVSVKDLGDGSWWIELERGDDRSPP